MNILKKLLHLYLSFFKISGFTLGGGAVMLPLMEEEFVHKRGWLTDEEILEIFSLVNSLPGIIAVKCAVMIGLKAAGIPGAIVSSLGVLTPPVTLIMALSSLLMRYQDLDILKTVFRAVRAGATALLLHVLIKMGRKNFSSFWDLIIAASAFILFRVLNVHPLLVILGAGLAGGIIFSVLDKKDSIQ